MSKPDTGRNGNATGAATAAERAPTDRPEGLVQERHFTKPGADPFDEVAWELRTARISGRDGSTIFEQKEVEFPASWSQQATNIVVENYFRGAGENRERSVRQMIGRVVDTIAGWGASGGYFRAAEDGKTFADELKHILLQQMAAFNSPVWFNVGIESEPQCSACFINRVEDSMASILRLAQTEGMLFKWGSGTGTNLSPLRSSRETLTGGGTASGPVSFMKGYDAFAGVIKSGGKCLAPSQRVYTEQGPVGVAELARRDGFVCLSYDPPAGRFKAKRARAWQSGRKALVRIQTDKGSFELSEDHPVRLSTGEYVHAGTLRAGHSLQRCAVDESMGYLRVHLQNGLQEKEGLHRLIAHDVLGWDIDDTTYTTGTTTRGTTTRTTCNG